MGHRPHRLPWLLVKLVVRGAAPSDATQVHDLVHQAFAAYAPLIGRRPAPMDEDYAQIVTSPWCRVAELDGRLVGVLVVRAEPDHLLLETVAVYPGAQGQGVGERLLREAESLAAQSDLAEVRLYTNEAMTGNFAWYAHHGYVETGRRVQDGFRRIFFAKRLLSPRGFHSSGGSHRR